MKIVEYLKLIPKGIANADKVVEGIINSTLLEKGSLPEDEKEEIIRRRVICEGCPFMSKNATLSEEYFSLAKKRYKTGRREKHCAMCFCPIEAKTASLNSNCGIEYFNEKHKTNIPLKWKKYEPVNSTDSRKD